MVMKSPLFKCPFGRKAHQFARKSDGAALVEFAILLPVMLLTFAVIIEGGRLFWSYQSAASGVRDAARYLARVAPRDICTTPGAITGYSDELLAIVSQSIDGNAIFPSGISVTAVTPTLSCVAGSFRISPAPVAQVTANLTVTFPFASVFAFSGSALGTITTTLSDQSRVYGT